MSWERIKPKGRGVGEPLRGVTCGIGVTGKGRTSLRVNIGSDVLQQLSWSPGQRCDVFFGQGENAGKVRLQRAAEGEGYKLTPGGGGKQNGNGTIVVGAWQGLPDNACRATAAEHSVDGNSLVVTLPKWPAPEVIEPATPAGDEPAPLDDAEEEVLGVLIDNRRSPKGGLASIANEARMGTETLRRHMRSLEAKGYITVLGDRFIIKRDLFGDPFKESGEAA